MICPSIGTASSTISNRRRPALVEMTRRKMTKSTITAPSTMRP